MSDRIRHITLSHVVLPLANPVSDAKVLTGRQKPLTETVLLFAEVTTEQGLAGMGFSYSKRAGGRAQFTHLAEVADTAIGADPSDIDRIYQSLLWAGASVGRSGVATQAIAALDVALWDLKARRAGLPLAKLIGAHRDSCRVYNTSGGFLQASVEEIKEKATASLESGIGGIKIKVGQPDWKTDLDRVAAIREHLGDTPLMVDANQQWDRARARRMCRELEAYDLVWIEEPLDAWDAVGHADLSPTSSTPRSRPVRCSRRCRSTWRSSTPATAASFSPTRHGSAASPRSCASRHWPHTPDWHWPRTMRWRSTCTWPPRIPPSHGSSTSSGSTHCSTSASTFTMARCGCPIGPASVSRSATRCGRSPRRPPSSAPR